MVNKSPLQDFLEGTRKYFYLFTIMYIVNFYCLVCMEKQKKPVLATENWKRAAMFKAPQSIIHINHYITLQQYKYWAYLLQELGNQFNAGIKPDEKGFYSMPMSKLALLVGYTPKKSEVWNDLKALKNETIEFNVLNKDKEEEKYGAGFISEWRVSNSYIRFKFPSFLEDVMRGLDDPKAMFSIINWSIFDHFSGKYEANIYKLCKDFIGILRTPTMPLDKFRRYMWIKAEEYPEFKKLNARVISEPVKRINESEVSDIMVFPEYFREGRKITALYFRIEHKRQTSMPFLDLGEDSPFRFAKYPLSPSLQQKLLAFRSQPEIELCIERANEYGEKQELQGNTVNYDALYAVAIKEGWHEQLAEKKQKSRKKLIAASENKKQALKEAEHASVTSKQRQEMSAKAWTWFSALTDEKKRQIEQDYLAQASELDIGTFSKKWREASAFRIYLRSLIV